jgi:hypothetical protein
MGDPLISILFLGSFVGVLSLAAKLLYQFFRLSRFQDMPAFNVFLLACSWLLTLGYLGFLSSAFFCFDLSSLQAKFVFMATGLVGLIGLAANLKKIKIHRPLFDPLNRMEMLLLMAIGLLLLNYFYRALAPWWDEDEVSKYGYYSKLIANGWTFSGIFKYLHQGDTRFAEAMHAQTFFILGNNIASKFLKVLTLMSSGSIVYFFLRALKIERIYGLLAVALFLGIPELAYLGPSLKTDATMMNFEIAAQCFLLLPLIFLFEGAPGRKRYLDESGLRHLLLACLFSFFALATKMVTIYLVLIAVAVFLFFLLRSVLNFKNKIILTSLLAVLGITILHHYVHNYFVFKNPFFPVGPVWPFQNGAYEDQYNVGIMRGQYNLKFAAPPIIYQLYLLIHIAMGFETTAFDFLKFLPHAVSRGNSLGWQTPTLLIFLLLPFLFKRSARFILTSGLFVVLFFLWAAGLQYTRCFFATSLLSIYITAFLLSENWRGNYQKKLVQLVIVFIGAVLLFEASYQLLFSYKKYYHSPMTVFQGEQRFKSTDRVLRFAPWVAQDHSAPLDFLDYAEVRQLDDRLKNGGELSVLLTNFEFKMGIYPVHAYFSNGLFVQDDIHNLLDGKVNERGLQLKDFTCVLVKGELGLGAPAQQQIDSGFPNDYRISEAKKIDLKCNKKIGSS